MKQIILNLRYGFAPASLVNFLYFGGVLITFDDIESGYQFAKLAFKLAERPIPMFHKARCFLGEYACIDHWKQDLKKTTQKLSNSYRMCMDAGDPEYASYSTIWHAIFLMAVGTDLRDLQQSFVQSLQLTERLKNNTGIYIIRICSQFVNKLRNPKEDFSLQPGPYNDEKRLLDLLYTSNDGASIHLLFFTKLMLAYLWQDIPSALEYGKTAKKHLYNAMTPVTVVLIYFYYTLASVGLYPTNAQISTESNY